MTVSTVLRSAVELIRPPGALARGTRRTVEAGIVKYCALGAVDFAEGEWPDKRDAVELLASLIDPEKDIVQDDRWNGQVVSNKSMADSPSVRVAWYSNTHSQGEVIALFERAIERAPVAA